MPVTKYTLKDIEHLVTAAKQEVRDSNKDLRSVVVFHRPWTINLYGATTFTQLCVPYIDGRGVEDYYTITL